ncbi:MAG TPA: putative metallopeptidase [Armatimonadota bacterium]|nr:putative metallopeptidase [Armatimonadota bacterium]
MRRQRPSINITEQLERIVTDICTRLPAFAHINPRRILLCLTRARQNSAGGTFAKIIPMRFPDASPFTTVSGQHYALPQIPTTEGDVLYLIYIYIPRFFTQSFERRLLVLIHELYHIAPQFDGTIRMVKGRAHGASRQQFNANLQPLVEQYLAADPPEELLSLLRSDFSALARQTHLTGRSLAIPKAVRLHME